jgi:secreted trypsin-like serine protease
MSPQSEENSAARTASLRSGSTSTTHMKSATAGADDDRQTRRQLIIGGQVARPGKYPYFALINRECGGSLIAPDIVLTAGHCKPHRTIRNSGESGAEVDHVRVGIVARRPNEVDWDEDDALISEEETFAVLDAKRHHRFERLGDDEFRYDFTLIRLNGTSAHPTIAINRDSGLWDRNYHATDIQVTAMGMGWTDKHRPSRSNLLREVNLTVVPNDICEQTHDDEESYKGRIGRSHLCTFTPHKDSCAYDSGSPIIWTPPPTTTTDDEPPHSMLVGMVSWGMECADTVFPAVNSRISSVATDWIDPIVCDWSENPPADFGCYASSSSEDSSMDVLTPDTGANGDWAKLRTDADLAFIFIMCLMAAVGCRLWWGRCRRSNDYEELK